MMTSLHGTLVPASNFAQLDLLSCQNVQVAEKQTNLLAFIRIVLSSN